LRAGCPRVFQERLKTQERGFAFTTSFLDEAAGLEGYLVRVRRTIHANPELAFQERETATLVARELRQAGINVMTEVGGTGVVGVLKGAAHGRTVALRADMDALPLQELSGEAFGSKTKGVMHACGHDSHVAMLLGAAKILGRHRAELKGNVKFLFQPAEEAGEAGGGATPMIDDGVLENPKVDFVFGLHIFTDFPSGTFALRPGPMMAASGHFRIKVIGRGGHGSAPHQTVDPVFVAAQIITALQGIKSRMVDPVEPSVVSVCTIHSGTRYNIIPDEAVLEGTMRTFTDTTKKRVAALIPQIAKSVCKSFGARCEVDVKHGYPVTVNDPAVTKQVSKLLKSIPGTRILDISPRLVGEDFSFFLQKVPGVYYFLGTRNEKKGCVNPNHSSRFKVDEDVMKFGSASLALLAFEFSGGDVRLRHR
jgi:carboxypeptidase Ss1